MSRRPESSGAVALGAAVFIAGAVLLGVEIVASRVLAPSFGNSLFVWGSLIGVVLTGLAVGYWVGGVLADRFPSFYLLLGTLTLGAGLVLLIPVADGWVIERIVDWDPGDRLNPLIASVVLFGPMAVVIASASPIAVRLAAQRGRSPRPHRRAAVLDLDRRQHRRHVRHRVLARARARHRPDARRRRPSPCSSPPPGLRCPIGCSRSRLGWSWPPASARSAGSPPAASEPGGCRRSSDNWSPLFRERERRTPGSARARTRRAPRVGYDVREARDTRYHRMCVLDGRRHALPALRQHVPERDEARRPVRDGLRLHRLHCSSGLAYAPSTRSVLFIGLGGGSAVKRMWRDFPSLLAARRRDRSRGRARGPPLVRPARGIAALEVTPEDGRRFLQTSNERWDMIVVDAYFADSIPFHLATSQFYELVRSRLCARRGRRLERDRCDRGRGLEAAALDGEDLPLGLPDGRAAPRGRWRRARQRDRRRHARARGRSRACSRATGTRSAPRSPRALDLRAAIRVRWEQPVPFEDVPLLTDGYAPTDALLLS